MLIRSNPTRQSPVSIYSTTIGTGSCEATLCQCYLLGVNYCNTVSRMAVAGGFVYAAFAGNQVLCLLHRKQKLP